MVLAELGHEVQEVAPPVDDEALARDFLTSWFAYVAASVIEAKRDLGATDADFEPDTLAMAAVGRAVGGPELSEGDRPPAQLHPRPGRVPRDLRPVGDADACSAAVAVGELDTPRVLQQAVRRSCARGPRALLPHVGMTDRMITRNLGWVPYTQLANLTGRPAMSVPLHWTAGGLPLGVQFVGRLGSERGCCSGWRRSSRRRGPGPGGTRGVGL